MDSHSTENILPYQYVPSILAFLLQWQHKLQKIFHGYKLAIHFYLDHRRLMIAV